LKTTIISTTSTLPALNGRTLRFAGAAAVLAALSFAYGCGGGSSSATRQIVTVPTSFATVDGPAGSPTTLNGISNNDTIVGFTTNNGVNNNFLDTVGKFSSFSVGDPAAGMGNAVNSHGEVVGVANNSAFLLSGLTKTVLSVPGSTSSVALGINDAGVIVGQYTAASGGATPGFVDVNGVFTTINPIPAAMVTNVQGVNNNGLAIGFYSSDGVHQHGFTYNINSKQVTLLADPSTARITTGGLVLTQFLGLNDDNEAVGYYQTNNGSQFGFLFNLNSKTYTFLDAPLAAPVSGVQITQITGVSNTGEICGFYVDATGVQHGFTGSSSSSNK